MVSEKKISSGKIKPTPDEQKSKSGRKPVRQLKKKQLPQELTVESHEGEVISQTEGHAHPYDENLLERSRTQWQFGDWASLAELSRETLQHHPDRAKLALLVAAGHTQQGNIGAARHFIQLADDWGCSRALINQVLVAGVHNTLGRAAAITGHGPRAIKHFETAISTGSPGSDRKLLVQARMNNQMEQIGIRGNDNLLPTLKLSAGQGNQIAAPFTQQSNAFLVEQLRTIREEIAALGNSNQQDLAKLRNSIEGRIKSELLNATKQMEAYLEIQNYLASGALTGNMHGWSISPDLGLYLIKLLESESYNLVIEFGSGTSTVLISKILSLRSGAHAQNNIPRPVQVAFEHLDIYHAQTLSELKQANLTDTTRLVLAPLRPFIAPNGETYQYYDCDLHLETLAKEFSGLEIRILVLVDGPPAVTGKHARYPALPMLMKHFKGANIDLLLDDLIREDEKQITRMWLGELTEARVGRVVKEINLEKGLFHLRTVL